MHYTKCIPLIQRKIDKLNIYIKDNVTKPSEFFIHGLQNIQVLMQNATHLEYF